MATENPITPTVADVLSDAGYSHEQIAEGLAYADRVGWRDENDRGSLALARILYSDEQLEDSPRAPWEA